MVYQPDIYETEEQRRRRRFASGPGGTFEPLPAGPATMPRPTLLPLTRTGTPSDVEGQPYRQYAGMAPQLPVGIQPSTTQPPTGGYGSVSETPSVPGPIVGDPLEELRWQIEGTQTIPYKKQGLWKRIGTGLLAGIHDWNQAGQPGGVWGILGALGAGAAAHGISNTVDKENRRRMDLGRLFNKYGQANVLEQSRLQTQGLQIGNLQKGIDLQGKIFEQNYAALNQALKDPLITEKKGYLTDADLDYLEKKYPGAGRLRDPNNAKFVERQNNGTWFIRPENMPHYVPSNLGTDPTKKGVQVTTAMTGTPVTVEPGTALMGEASEAEGIANRAQQVTLANQREVNDAAAKDISNLLQWHGQAAMIRTQMLTNAATVLQNAPEAQGHNSEVQRQATNVTIAAQKLNNAKTPTEVEAAQKEINSAHEAFNAASERFYESLGKVAGGAYIVDQLRNALPAAPNKTPVREVQPATRPQAGKNKAAGTVGSYQQYLDRIKKRRQPR